MVHTQIQTILVFLIMIYECEFCLRNLQLHLCTLISLLHVIPSVPTLSTLDNGIPIISTVHFNIYTIKNDNLPPEGSSTVYIAAYEGKEKEQVMIIIIKPTT